DRTVTGVQTCALPILAAPRQSCGQFQLMRVRQGRVVLLDYMVRVGTGRVVETSAGKAPIEYLHGAGQILPALERALEGLKEGERSEERRVGKESRCGR